MLTLTPEQFEGVDLTREARKAGWDVTAFTGFGLIKQMADVPDTDITIEKLEGVYGVWWNGPGLSEENQAYAEDPNLLKAFLMIASKVKKP